VVQSGEALPFCTKAQQPNSDVLSVAFVAAQVMAGQGTVAVELLQQLSPQGLDAIIVPVGGGGLIGGIAAVVKAWNPDVQVIDAGVWGSA
jgi:threonine dehydratase